MKKKKYLMKIFMHLHAPLKERIQMVKDLGRSLDDKLAEGETIEEAIAELGEASDIIQEYEDLRMRKRTKEWALAVIWILIGIVVGYLLFTECRILYRGYNYIIIRTSPNTGVGVAYGINVGAEVVKVVFESIGFIICVGNVIWHFIKQKRKKEM